jgi:hypothetical protein
MRRPVGERVDAQEVYPMIDIMIAAGTMATLVLIAVALERIERTR